MSVSSFRFHTTFRNSYVVELNGDVYLGDKVQNVLGLLRKRKGALTLREFGDGLVRVLEAADDIGERCGSPEVLLLQTELLTNYMRMSAVIFSPYE